MPNFKSLCFLCVFFLAQAYAQVVIPLGNITLSNESAAAVQTSILSTNGGYSLALAAPVGLADTSISFTSLTGVSAPVAVVLDFGLAAQEAVTITAITGNVASTIVRGTLGTMAKAHLVTATVNPLLYVTIPQFLKHLIAVQVSDIMQRNPGPAIQAQLAIIAAAQAQIAVLQAAGAQ